MSREGPYSVGFGRMWRMSLFEHFHQVHLPKLVRTIDNLGNCTPGHGLLARPQVSMVDARTDKGRERSPANHLMLPTYFGARSAKRSITPKNMMLASLVPHHVHRPYQCMKRQYISLSRSSMQALTTSVKRRAFPKSHFSELVRDQHSMFPFVVAYRPGSNPT